MTLKATSKVPYGNARDISVRQAADMPEVHFAADPHGGPECLWFCLRVYETDPQEVAADATVRVALKYVPNMLGASSPSSLLPVSRQEGQAWVRMKPGKTEELPDGQYMATWVIPHPTPAVDIAFCYPYGRDEIDQLLQKSRGYWHRDAIGLSQQGRTIARLSNDYGKPGGRRPGVYLVARQHSGETPGSWVLDGLLQHLSRDSAHAPVTWAVPLTNIDGVIHGDYGKDNFPYDLNRAWGSPPMRHETRVMQQDIRRWKERCRPTFAIDFHAPGASETAGVYAFMPDPEKFADANRQATKWANVIDEALRPDHAAEDFRRVADYHSRWGTPTFVQHMSELGIPSLALETPYAMCGKTVLSQKRYREIGKRVAEAIVRRAK